MGLLSALIHKATHVWQHQNGGDNYIIRALHAQTFGDGYNYQKGIKEGKSWTQLNAEQQAQLVGAAYAGGFFNSGLFVDEFKVVRSDLTTYIQNALPQLRLGIGAR